MTEYNEEYNWEKTWLNSAPLGRGGGTRRSAEPHFQHKRHFEQNNSYSMWGPKSPGQEILEDPFFIIHGRRHSEIAYPNILYRRSKSAPRQRKVPSPINERTQTSTRPKSEEATNVSKAVKPQQKKHHSKSSSEVKKKKPIERWPELKMDIPKDSPQTNLPAKSEYQRSFSPPAAYNYTQNGRQSAKIPLAEGRKEDIKISENKRIKIASDRRSNRKSASSVQPSELTSNLQNDKVESKSELRRRRLQSEYRANYKNLSDYTCVAKLQNDEAKQNQQQVEGCHFSRKHFNQLDSNNANLWDPPSTLSEIVGVDPKVRERRIKEYNDPPARRPLNTSRSDSALKCPENSLNLRFKYPAPSLATRYEPSKYSNQQSHYGETRKTNLASEKMDAVGCTLSHHMCGTGGGFLVSRPRPTEMGLPPPQTHRPCCSSPPSACASPFPISTNLSLAEHTLDRALCRRNKLLISACRN